MNLIANGESLLNHYTSQFGLQTVQLAKKLITEMEEIMQVSCPSVVTLCAAANQVYETTFVQSDTYSYQEKFNAFVVIKNVWCHGEEFNFWASTYHGIIIFSQNSVVC